jgi:hypothetical protein
MGDRSGYPIGLSTKLFDRVIGGWFIRLGYQQAIRSGYQQGYPSRLEPHEDA